MGRISMLSLIAVAYLISDDVAPESQVMVTGW